MNLRDAVQGLVAHSYSPGSEAAQIDMLDSSACSQLIIDQKCYHLKDRMRNRPALMLHSRGWLLSLA